MRLPRVAYADDFKFVGNVAVHRRAVIQTEIDIEANWSTECKMPLSIVKSLVMYCGSHQPNYECSLNECKIKCVDSFSDLGVQRSLINGYTGHYQTIACKAAKVAGTLRHVFHNKKRELMRTAFH